jgi:hypothetical protein
MMDFGTGAGRQETGDPICPPGFAKHRYAQQNRSKSRARHRAFRHSGASPETRPCSPGSGSPTHLPLGRASPPRGDWHRHGGRADGRKPVSRSHCRDGEAPAAAPPRRLGGRAGLLGGLDRTPHRCGPHRSEPARRLVFHRSRLGLGHARRRRSRADRGGLHAGGGCGCYTASRGRTGSGIVPGCSPRGERSGSAASGCRAWAVLRPLGISASPAIRRASTARSSVRAAGVSASPATSRASSSANRATGSAVPLSAWLWEEFPLKPG